MLVGRESKVLSNSHPSILPIIVEVGHHDPDARHQMDHDEEGEEESDETVQAELDLRKLLKILEHLVFFSNDLEHLEQARQFYQLVHSSYPGYSHNFIKVFGVSEEQVEWDDCNSVDHEPGSDIHLGDLLSVYYKVKVFIIESRIENLAYIYEEHNIYNLVEPYPGFRFIFNKG